MAPQQAKRRSRYFYCRRYSTAVTRGNRDLQSFEELNVLEKGLGIGKLRTIRHCKSWELLIECSKQCCTLQFGCLTLLPIPSVTQHRSAAEKEDFVSCATLTSVALPSIMTVPDKVVGRWKALWRRLPPTPSIFASSELFPLVSESPAQLLGEQWINWVSILVYMLGQTAMTMFDVNWHI